MSGQTKDARLLGHGGERTFDFWPLCLTSCGSCAPGAAPKRTRLAESLAG